jgi:AcrR family transcriptional regulator
MKPVSESPTVGLRERKKQRTRLSIQKEAMRLFREQGYEKTTIQQICDVAEVSQSTFFNYFPTKEEVVFTDDYDPLFVEHFLSRPTGEPVLAALRNAFNETFPSLLERERDAMLERGLLAFRVPALRARAMAELDYARNLLASIIAERLARDREDFEIRIGAALIVAAVWEAGVTWVGSGGNDDYVALINEALNVVEKGVALV